MKNKKVVFVKEKYRVNPLSSKPGGMMVAVELPEEDYIKVYSNVKNFGAFAATIRRNNTGVKVYEWTENEN